VMDILAEINRDDGITVVVSLHQVGFALRYCRRIVALNRGRVVYDGPASAMTTERLCEIYGSGADLDFGEAEPNIVRPAAPRSLPVHKPAFVRAAS
jgi:phosphonate transport system ATP-binding protein